MKMGTGYAVAARTIMGVEPDDNDTHAAAERLASHRHFEAMTCPLTAERRRCHRS
ncbi:hypothetical protein [Janibacter sp. LM]|uniref:hypothetical protein n=1 Tax=Janibacter sp. LM TaxID=3144845 RepID=UPI0031F682B5